MNDFFKKAIDKSLDIDCLDKTIIVIPNRRSRGFLKQVIQNRLEKTSISKPLEFLINIFSLERISSTIPSCFSFLKSILSPILKIIIS